MFHNNKEYFDVFPPFNMNEIQSREHGETGVFLSSKLFWLGKIAIGDSVNSMPLLQYLRCVLCAGCKQISVTIATSSADKCGGNIRISSASYLTSPGYPISYAPSQRCTWVISAPGPHQRILINFNPHFDLEDRECKWVAPPVWALWEQMCGKTTHPVVHFKGNSFRFFSSAKVGEWQDGTAKTNKHSVFFFPSLCRPEFVKPHYDTFIYIWYP